MCHVKYLKVFASTVLPKLRQNRKFRSNFLLFYVGAKCNNIPSESRAAVRYSNFQEYLGGQNKVRLATVSKQKTATPDFCRNYSGAGDNWVGSQLLTFGRPLYSGVNWVQGQILGFLLRVEP
jgi:hypothetical protein